VLKAIGNVGHTRIESGQFAEDARYRDGLRRELAKNTAATG